VRLVRAELKDAYKVHKCYTEALSDRSIPCPSEDSLYAVWTSRLTHPDHIYLLLTHGKKLVGMVWGQELQGEAHKTILIEGRHLRRGYRKNKRFSRDLLSAVKEMSSGFETVRMILHPKGVKLSPKYIPLGVMVELRSGEKKNG